MLKESFSNVRANYRASFSASHLQGHGGGVLADQDHVARLQMVSIKRKLLIKISVLEKELLEYSCTLLGGSLKAHCMMVVCTLWQIPCLLFVYQDLETHFVEGTQWHSHASWHEGSGCWLRSRRAKQAAISQQAAAKRFPYHIPWLLHHCAPLANKYSMELHVWFIQSLGPIHLTGVVSARSIAFWIKILHLILVDFSRRWLLSILVCITWIAFVPCSTLSQICALQKRLISSYRDLNWVDGWPITCMQR